jgi:hypothetical protein
MTELYERMIKGSPALGKLWAETPWVVRHWTDSINSVRYEEIHDWLSDHFGRAKDFVLNDEGNWMMGSATIKGYTRIGFSTEEAMKEFVEEWK